MSKTTELEKGGSGLKQRRRWRDVLSYLQSAGAATARRGGCGIGKAAAVVQLGLGFWFDRGRSR